MIAFLVFVPCQRCSHLQRFSQRPAAAHPERTEPKYTYLGAVGRWHWTPRRRGLLRLFWHTTHEPRRREARHETIASNTYGVSHLYGASFSSTSPSSAVAIFAHSPASVPTYAPRIATLATLNDMDASTLSSSESTRTTTLAAAALAATALGFAVLVSRPRVNPWRSWRWSRRWRVLDSVMQCHHSGCRRSHLGPRCCILLMACDAEVFARSS